jgi:thiamine monophosphate kinase
MYPWGNSTYTGEPLRPAAQLSSALIMYINASYGNYDVMDVSDGLVHTFNELFMQYYYS